jgi:surfeit locus 1 family protein
VDNGETDTSSFNWSWNWKICLFSFTMLPLMVFLGFWQLDRAQQKRTLQDAIALQQGKPPLDWSAATGLAEQDLRYRTVTMAGRVDLNRVLLVENQVWQGRLGYHLVVPLYLAEGGAVLVNFGWLAATQYREALPPIPSLDAVNKVTGKLTKPSRNRLLTAAPLGDQWPQTTLQIDIEQFQPAVTAPLLDWVLQIDAQDPAALAVAWQTLQMPPEKHLGYAVQWFAMSLVLMALTVFANSNLGQVLRLWKKKQ